MTICYAAIRKNIEYEWIDSSSISCTLAETTGKHRAIDAHIPCWAKDNPVIRIVRVKVEEISE